MTDIYAEFGVNNAVISSSNITEHEQNMLALNVDARDGDDALTIEEAQEEAQEEELGEEDDGADETSEGEGEPDEGLGDDVELLPEASDELKDASQKLSQYADGFTALRDQAIKSGLTEDMAAQIEAEYESESGLSDASYKALADAGYSRNFVDSYIQGQESIAHQFVAQVVEYAGGKDRFDKIMKHMGASSPESVESLHEAMERQDLKAIRTIINLGIQSHTKKFGKAPARNVAKAAPAVPAKRSAPSVQGYETRKEMIADMGKAEYRLDANFRAKVEARVLASQF
ncbi:capsid assembly protein [Pseudomonas solani]|uniref:capsid assembly protein n=1 Tax=Pseudomonas solani TaxID=2731552 RepID=UPI003F4AEB22